MLTAHASNAVFRYAHAACAEGVDGACGSGDRWHARPETGPRSDVGRDRMTDAHPTRSSQLSARTIIELAHALTVDGPCDIAGLLGSLREYCTVLVFGHNPTLITYALPSPPPGRSLVGPRAPRVDRHHNWGGRVIRWKSL
eukprot:6596820-Prymnesium_polylepis.1